MACEKADPPAPNDECPTVGQASAQARLLTRSEYRRTVRDLLDTRLDPTTAFPPEPVVAGFENDASSHQPNPLLVEKHAAAAALLATDLLERGIETIFTCEEESPSEDCAFEFVDSFGLRAFRRPLTKGERASFLELYDQANPSLGHNAALATVVEAFLQSPQFLYRVEAPISQAGGQAVKLGPYEMASRLSYFFWGTMPDKRLLEAAAKDELSTAEQVSAQARRLVASSRAQARAREFHDQWLGLRNLLSVARNDAPEDAGQSWYESTHRFIDGVLWGETPTAPELFTSSVVHFDAPLASLYGFEASEDWQTAQDPSRRHGLLTQPGLMALLSHAEQSSPVQRGVFVREHILCEEVKPPPPTVDDNPPDPDPSLTTRERFQIHTESPVCANCHRVIDPVGFGFESYDHLGRHRATENGIPIDASGAILEVKETAIEGEFADTEQLTERIAHSETAVGCLARKWFTFAMGRAHSSADTCSTDQALELSASSGGDLRELLVQLAASPAFRYRPAHESDHQRSTP
jgi:hypothetical protein